MRAGECGSSPPVTSRDSTVRMLAHMHTGIGCHGRPQFSARSFFPRGCRQRVPPAGGGVHEMVCSLGAGRRCDSRMEGCRNHQPPRLSWVPRSPTCGRCLSIRARRGMDARKGTLASHSMMSVADDSGAVGDFPDYAELPVSS